MSQHTTPGGHKLFHRPGKANPASKNQMLSEAVSGLKMVTEIVNPVTDVVDVGPPGLNTGLTGLIYVLDAIQVSDHTHSRIVLYDNS